MAELTFDQKIRNAIEKIAKTRPSYRAAKQAMASLDLTSLNDTDSEQSIRRLCKKAGRVEGHYPAAICVYPQFVKIAADELSGRDVGVATVVNFPFGRETNDGAPATIGNTRGAVETAIADGATEIDIVMDYQGFHEMEPDLARDLLNACRAACGDQAKMKVILETSAFRFENEVFDMAKTAMDCGADMIKTSTGKHDNGGASLPMVAAMAFAIRDYKTSKPIGLKVSGGVNGSNYASYIALIGDLLDDSFITPKTFRFGASGVFEDLQLTLETKGQVKPQQKIPSSAY